MTQTTYVLSGYLHVLLWRLRRRLWTYIFCSHLNTRCSQQHEKQVRYLAKRCILYNGTRPDISWAAWPLTFRWPTLKYLQGCPPHPSLLNTPLPLAPLFQPSPSLPAPTALVAPTVRTSINLFTTFVRWHEETNLLHFLSQIWGENNE